VWDRYTKLGTREKVAAIFTSIENLPFKDGNKHSWIADYCDLCGNVLENVPKEPYPEK
jgi:hypothetical protein